MSVWVAEQKDTSATLRACESIILPWADMPDLTQVNSRGALRTCLNAIHPESPPEAMNTRIEEFWAILGGMHKEDIVAVPLPSENLVMVGEIIGGYVYRDGQHTYPMRWFDQTLPMTRFARHADTPTGVYEVQNAKLRTLIREAVPTGYNRFSKWKWLLGIGLTMQAIIMLERIFRGGI